MAVLDASFLIDLEAKLPTAVRLVNEFKRKGEPLFVPAQAAAEVIAGTLDPLILWNRLNRAFTVVFPKAEHVLESARLFQSAKGRGNRVAWADAQIAAVAMLEADQVITANPRDFEAMNVPCLDHRNAEDESSAAA